MSTKQKQQSTTNQTQAATTTRDPYAPAVPGLVGGAEGITNWMQGPTAAQAYSGPRVAQMTGTTDAGIDELAAAEGARRAQDYYTRTLGGEYLTAGNPYTTALTDATLAKVMPAINSRISASGMAPGSSVDQSLVARGVADATAAPLFQNYEAERMRQMAAANALPAVAAQAAQQGIVGGQMREAYDQRNIDAARQDFEERRLAGLRPYAEAVPLLNQIGAAGGSGSSSGNTSGTTTQVMSNQPSPLQVGIGAGMMGTGLFGGGGMFPGALTNLFGASRPASGSAFYTPDQMRSLNGYF